MRRSFQAPAAFVGLAAFLVVGFSASLSLATNWVDLGTSSLDTTWYYAAVVVLFRVVDIRASVRCAGTLTAVVATHFRKRYSTHAWPACPTSSCEWNSASRRSSPAPRSTGT